MKSFKSVLLLSAMALAFVVMSGNALAGITYQLPPIYPPEWWKTPNDLPPDGYTKIEFHCFSTDPNWDATHGPIYPDYGYNGFQSSFDVWGGNGEPPEFGVDIDAPTDPFGGDNKGVSLIDMTNIHKVMYNLDDPSRVKTFYVGMIWYDASANHTGTLTIGCESEGSEVILYAPQNWTDTNTPAWHYSVQTGTIIPQPGVETFTFTFGNGALPWADSVWVGTTCIPEPGTIAMMLFGGLGVVGGVIRKFRR